MYSVTSAPQSAQSDRDYRMHRYLLSMGIRTVCFVLSVLFIAVLHWTIAGWILVVAAVLLPYVAVVMANAASSHGGKQGVSMVAPPNSPQQLPGEEDPLFR